MSAIPVQPHQRQDSRYKRRILITGGAGFIGSHVVIHFVTRYPEYFIVNFDSLDYCSCLENVHANILKSDGGREKKRGSQSNETHTDDDIGAMDTSQTCSNHSLAENYKFIKGDITCADLVEYVLRTECIDTVLHLAAQSHVDNSFSNSILFSHTNILGTHVLLEAARRYGKIRRFVHVSTDEVYGEGLVDDAPMGEDHVLEPTNPYAATKAGAEFLVKAYQRSFHLPVIITRSNNVYGPHQYPEKLIPKLINQALRCRPLTIHGDGQNARTYVYISDAVSAFDVILHSGRVGEVYNVGGTQERSNLQVAHDITRLARECGGNTVNVKIDHVPDRLFNDRRYTIDSTKLQSLGWHPLVEWQTGLRETFVWYALHHNRYQALDNALEAHPSSTSSPPSRHRYYHH